MGESGLGNRPSTSRPATASVGGWGWGGGLPTNQPRWTSGHARRQPTPRVNPATGPEFRSVHGRGQRVSARHGSRTGAGSGGGGGGSGGGSSEFGGWRMCGHTMLRPRPSSPSLLHFPPPSPPPTASWPGFPSRAHRGPTPGLESRATGTEDRCERGVGPPPPPPRHGWERWPPCRSPSNLRTFEHWFARSQASMLPRAEVGEQTRGTGGMWSSATLPNLRRR